MDADLEQSVRSAYLQERANEAAATYKAVENGANVFDQGMFITVRADEKEDLRDAVQKVKSALRDDPANLTPKTAICRQDLALQSAAPIGDNEFGLNHAQMQFVQDAVPGNEDAGFSEALVGVDGEWRGIQVKAMPKEKQVIDFDPTSQIRSSLPGAGDDAVDTEMEEFQEELEHRATNGTNETSELNEESDAVEAEPDGGSTEGINDG